MRKTLSATIAAAMIGSGMGTAQALAPTADVPPWNTITKPVPATNPLAPENCGIDFSLVLDASGSIQEAGAVDQVRDAAGAFLGALANTGSKARMVNFGTKATMSAPMTEITTDSLKPDGTLGLALESYYNVPGGGGGLASPLWRYITAPPLLNPLDPASWSPTDPGGLGTNWQDALQKSVGSDPADVPELVVFITDGDPNVVVSDGQSNQGLTPDPHPGDYLTGGAVKADAPQAWQYALYKGINASNGVKTSGSPTRMLAVGVGNALSGADSLNNLKDAAGPNLGDTEAKVWTGPGDGPFEINTYGVSRVTDFNDLAAALQAIATDLCKSSITIKKLSQSPTSNSYEPASGWDMTVNPTISSGSYTWVSPDPGAPMGPKTAATDASGQVLFQWKPDGNFGSSVQVSETLQPDYAFKDAACRRVDNGVPSNEPPFVNGDATFTNKDFTIPVGAESIVTCVYRNSFVPDPKIEVVKQTNGVAANVPGLELVYPDKVSWSYKVSNTGNNALKNVALTDDKVGQITCPKTTLAIGESMTCEANGNTVLGDYQNTAEVTADDDWGNTVKDTDSNQYVALQPDIKVVKKINGAGNLDNGGSRVDVQVGKTYDVTFEVTNTGTAPLQDVSVTDKPADAGDPALVVSCPQTTLAVGAAMTCTASGTAKVGTHDDTATATGTGTFTDGSPLKYADGKAVPPVTDTSSAGYIAKVAAIEIVKKTNGTAATAPGLELVYPDKVTWSYKVTNTGELDLTEVSVSDDKVGAITCPKTALAVGDSMTCEATGDTVLGDYTNTATATGKDKWNATVQDSDRNQYVALQPKISVVKEINGAGNLDNGGSRVQVQETDELLTTYRVTNTGTTKLVDVTVTDQPLSAGIPVPSVTCPRETLQPGQIMTCTSVGVAIRGAHDDRVTAAGTGTFSNGQPLTYRDGRPVAPVSATSTAGYNASAIAPAARIVRRVYCRPTTGSVAGERAFCKVRMNKKTGRVQVKVLGYRKIRATVVIGATRPITVKANKVRRYPPNQFVTLVRSSRMTGDEPRRASWRKTWTLRKK